MADQQALNNAYKTLLYRLFTQITGKKFILFIFFKFYQFLNVYLYKENELAQIENELNQFDPNQINPDLIEMK